MKKAMTLTGLMILMLIAVNFIPLPASVNAFSGAGSGTEADPYQISNAAQLQEMADDLSAYYLLVNNIDCSSISNFDPIGDDANPFTGTFNGNGYTINNLTINRPAEDYIGLFGKISSGDGMDITNVALENVYIIGNDKVGGGVWI